MIAYAVHSVAAFDLLIIESGFSVLSPLFLVSAVSTRTSTTIFTAHFFGGVFFSFQLFVWLFYLILASNVFTSFCQLLGAAVMFSYKLPNVPYNERPANESFHVYSNTSALLEGRGFARMTPLTRRLSTHLQGTTSDTQPNGFNSIAGNANPKLSRATKPRLMLMGQRRWVVHTTNVE